MDRVQARTLGLILGDTLRLTVHPELLKAGLTGRGVPLVDGGFGVDLGDGPLDELARVLQVDELRAVASLAAAHEFVESRHLVSP